MVPVEAAVGRFASPARRGSAGVAVAVGSSSWDVQEHRHQTSGFEGEGDQPKTEPFQALLDHVAVGDRELAEPQCQLAVDLCERHGVVLALRETANDGPRVEVDRDLNRPPRANGGNNNENQPKPADDKCAHTPPVEADAVVAVGEAQPQRRNNGRRCHQSTGSVACFLENTRLVGDGGSAEVVGEAIRLGVAVDDRHDQQV